MNMNQMHLDTLGVSKNCGALRSPVIKHGNGHFSIYIVDFSHETLHFHRLIGHCHV